MAMPRVEAVVVHYNNWPETRDCLAALERVRYPALSVVVCENGSTDGSRAQLDAWHATRPTSGPPLHARVVHLPTNQGYTGGCNAGIHAALHPPLHPAPDYLWLVNNDAQPEPDALAALVHLAATDPRLGIVGSLLVHRASGRVEALGGGRLVPWLGETPHARAGHDVRATRALHHDAVSQHAAHADRLDFICGASMLVRTAMIHDVGDLDERLFLYADDLEWCLRAIRRGWRIAAAPASVVLHGSGATAKRTPAVADFYHVRNRLLVIRRDRPAHLATAAAYHLVRCVLSKLLRGRWRRAARCWQGLLAGLTEPPLTTTGLSSPSPTPPPAAHATPHAPPRP